MRWSPAAGPEVIARHSRSYERDDFVYDPIHYLPLLERRAGALDQAAPWQGWELPEEFGTLRRLLESRMERRGKREFVQVLRVLETISQKEVPAAVKDALRLGGTQLRRGEAPGAVPVGGTAAPAGSPSPPGWGAGEHDICRGIPAVAVREGGMRTTGPRCYWNTT